MMFGFVVRSQVMSSRLSGRAPCSPACLSVCMQCFDLLVSLFYLKPCYVACRCSAHLQPPPFSIASSCSPGARACGAAEGPVVWQSPVAQPQACCHSTALLPLHSPVAPPLACCHTTGPGSGAAAGCYSPLPHSVVLSGGCHRYKLWDL